MLLHIQDCKAQYKVLNQCTCQTVTCHGVHLHIYDHDCQLYLSTSIQDIPLTVNKFTAYVADVNAWLNANRIWLTREDSGLVALLTQMLDRIMCKDIPVLGHTSQNPNLHAILELSLTMNCHWQHTTLLFVKLATTNYANSNQWSARCPYMPPRCMCRHLSHHLDDCNSLLYSISNGLLCHYQSVQNAAVCLVTLLIAAATALAYSRQQVVFKITGSFINHRLE